MSKFKDPEIKKKLIEALRSGKYEQCKSRLRISKNNETSYTYCCLGVLCVITNQNWDTDYYYPYSEANRRKFLDEFTYLPATLASEFCITINGSFVDDTGKENSLASLNDNDYSFNQIADVIEKHFLTVS